MSPTDHERQVVDLLAKTFIYRRDLKSWQQADGSYVPDRSPITRDDLTAHVTKQRTMGHFPVAPDGKCKFFAFDLDLKQTIQWGDETLMPRDIFQSKEDPLRTTMLVLLQNTALAIARRTYSMFGIHVAASFSGSKGLHVYGLSGECPAAEAREGAFEVLRSFGVYVPTRGSNFWGRADITTDPIEIEVYPKQDKVGQDEHIGNLIRLPLGVNRKTGWPGTFLRLDSNPTKLHQLDPIAALTNTLPWVS